MFKHLLKVLCLATALSTALADDLRIDMSNGLVFTAENGYRITFGATIPTSTTVLIYFDYTYFDANMQASLDYTSAEYTKGSTFGSLPSCSSTGPRYFHLNWRDSDYNVWDTSSTVPDAPMTLHAYFHDLGESSYSLTFDLQSGSGNTPIIPLWDGWSFGSGDYGGDNFPADPTYTDYAFSGWFTATGGTGSRVYSTDTYNYSTYYGSLTLYAYWIPTSVTIYFDYNYFQPYGSLQATLEYSSAAYTPGQELVELPSCTSIGPRWSFSGWLDENYTSWDVNSTAPFTSTTLHAYFSDNNNAQGYTVFDLQSGSGSTPSINLYEGWPFQSGDFGDGSFPADPTYTGYIFGGWFSSTGGGGTRIYPTDTYSYSTYYGTVYLYAYWIPTLTFDLQGGSGDTPIIPITYGYYYNAFGSFPADPTYEGYTFSGWFTEANGAGTRVYENDSNNSYSPVTLYAYWPASLTFDLQGGTGDTPSIPLTYMQILSYGGSFPSDPTLDGYTFGGWYTEPSGAGSSISSWDYYYSTGNITAYAYWY